LEKGERDAREFGNVFNTETEAVGGFSGRVGLGLRMCLIPEPRTWVILEDELEQV
jgi:hypothetical protein